MSNQINNSVIMEKHHLNGSRIEGKRGILWELGRYLNRKAVMRHVILTT